METLVREPHSNGSRIIAKESLATVKRNNCRRFPFRFFIVCYVQGNVWSDQANLVKFFVIKIALKQMIRRN